MCQLCETKPVYEFTNKRKLCKTCFIKWFQKKVLYTIRKFNMIKSGEIIAYKKGNKINEVVLENILKMYSEKGHVTIKEKTQNSKLKIAIPTNADTETHAIIDELFNSKLKNHNPVNQKIIKPLYLFLNKEILLYAKLKNLKFNKIKKEKNKLKDFVNQLEKKHPELKQAVIKNWLGLKK